MSVIPSFAQPRLSRRRALWLIVAASFALAVLSSGRRALWDTSETRYAEAAREMLSSGNWLYPTLGGKPHLTKPPVSYWLIAGSMKVFGTNETAARLPNSAAYAGSVLLVGLVAEELFAASTVGLAAAAFQALSPLIYTGSQVLTADMLVTAFELLYLLGILRTVGADSRKGAFRWSIVASVRIILAFLTKGPPALLPLLPVIVFVAWKRRSSHWRMLLHPINIVLILAGCTWWFVAVHAKLPQASQVWRTEALQKVMVASERSMPAILFLPIIFGGALPASALLAWYAVARKGYRGLRNVRNISDPMLFCALWLIVPLLVFCVSRTRLPLYVAPLIAPVNITAAFLAVRVFAESRSKRRLTALAVSGTVLWVSAIFVTYLVIAAGGYKNKDWRGEAEAIRRDSASRLVCPELVFTMPIRGNGLLFYLGGPPDRRLGGTSAHQGKTAQLASVFKQAVPSGVCQYIVLEADNVEKYRGAFDAYIATVYGDSDWVVWRRTTNEAVSISTPEKKSKS